MKRSLSLIFEFLVTLGSCLASCLGCSSKHPPDSERPHTIHWKGQDTGYQGTITELPADNAGTTGQNKFK